MNILYVYAHPNLDSFNHAMKEMALETLKEQGHHIKISDLYQMRFKASADWQDFIDKNNQFPNQYMNAQSEAYKKQLFSPDIKEEQEKLLWADLVIFQFPLWWFGMPAIMKGWMDRVFAKGFAYDVGMIFEKAKLVGKKVMLVTTTQSPETAFSEFGLNGTINSVFHSSHHSLRFVGFSILPFFVAYSVAQKNEKERQQMLENFKVHLIKIEKLKPLSFPALSEYDEKLILKDHDGKEAMSSCAKAQDP